MTKWGNVNLQKFLVNNMDKENLKKLIADSFTPSNSNINLQEKEIKAINDMAEKMTDAIIAYVNAELINLINSLNLQNAYTISNSNANSSETFSGITVVPSEIKNYRPLISKE